MTEEQFSDMMTVLREIHFEVTQISDAIASVEKDELLTTIGRATFEAFELWDEQIINAITNGTKEAMQVT